MDKSLSDQEKLERLKAFNARYAQMQRHKQKQLKRSKKLKPLDWQRNKEKMGEEPTDQAGQKRFYKIRTDVIDKLITAGRLKEEHRLAVHDIRRIWRAMGRGLFPGARKLDGLVVDGRSRYRDPLERMSDLENQIYSLRYKPWADMVSKIPVRKNRQETLFTLTLDMVVDNQGASQWEERNGYPKGRTATRSLARSLELYLET